MIVNSLDGNHIIAHEAGETFPDFRWEGHLSMTQCEGFIKNASQGVLEGHIDIVDHTFVAVPKTSIWAPLLRIIGRLAVR